MTMVVLVQILLERFGIRQVAVVSEHDAVRRIDVKGLRLLIRTRTALRRVAHVTDADIARQITHVARTEDVAHQAHGLMNVELQTVERRDARRILAAMLQKEQRVVEALINRFIGKEGNNAAHGCNPRLGRGERPKRK